VCKDLGRFGCAERAEPEPVCTDTCNNRVRTGLHSRRSHDQASMLADHTPFTVMCVHLPINCDVCLLARLGSRAPRCTLIVSLIPESWAPLSYIFVTYASREKWSCNQCDVTLPAPWSRIGLDEALVQNPTARNLVRSYIFPIRQRAQLPVRVSHPRAWFHSDVQENSSLQLSKAHMVLYIHTLVPLFTRGPTFSSFSSQ
jgi:hypothetical protein